jgi:hypothetical protein
MTTQVGCKKSEGYLDRSTTPPERNTNVHCQIERLRTPFDQIISLKSNVPSRLFVKKCIPVVKRRPLQKLMKASSAKHAN